MNPGVNDLRGWMPIRFYRADERYIVDWCYMGAERLTRPFFEDSVNARFRRPFSLLFRHQTPIEFLGKMFDGSRGIRPTGFIFHSSRCGSTLVSQMLASVGTNIVLSEPPPIDSILRANTAGLIEGEETRIEWLKWMVNAFGQKRDPGEERLFIKFDSWSTTDIGLIKRAFPDVPWIFLYRDPIEVIVSQMNQRGMHMIPGHIPGMLPGVGSDRLAEMPHEEYCARVFERICRSALQHAGDSRGLFVNYTELPAAVTDKIGEHFRLRFSPGELDLMRSAARFNAKTPQLEFAPDADEKVRAASDKILAAAELIDPVYRQLEQIRVTND